MPCSTLSCNVASSLNSFLYILRTRLRFFLRVDLEVGWLKAGSSYMGVVVLLDITGRRTHFHNTAYDTSRRYGRADVFHHG